MTSCRPPTSTTGPCRPTGAGNSRSKSSRRKAANSSSIQESGFMAEFDTKRFTGKNARLALLRNIAELSSLVGRLLIGASIA